MEFQGVITGAGGTPLGTFASVQNELAEMFPELVFQWSASGLQKLADIDSRRIGIPATVRRILEAQPSSLVGSVDHADFSVSFSLGSIEPVTRVWTTLGGNTASVESALRLFHARPGWIIESPPPLAVVKLGPGQRVQLTGDATLYFEDPRRPQP